MILKVDDRLVDDARDESKDATVRYELEEVPAVGDRLRLATPDGELFAIVRVRGVTVCPLELAHVALDAHYASYPTRDPADLARELSRYYEGDLGPTSEVAVIVWDLEEWVL